MFLANYWQLRRRPKALPLPSNQSSPGRKLRYLLLVPFVAGVGWVISVRLFIVRSVACQPSGPACNEQVEAELARIIGQPILRLSTQSIADKIKQGNPEIEEVRITVRFPDKAIVELIPRTAAVRLTAPGSETIVIADPGGFIFRAAGEADRGLPLVSSAALTGMSLGQAIVDAPTRLAIRLAMRIDQAMIPTRVVWVQPGQLEVDLDSGVSVLFSQEVDALSKVPSLQRILSEVTIDSRSRTVDLRHEKPVVVLD